MGEANADSDFVMPINRFEVTTTRELLRRNALVDKFTNNEIITSLVKGISKN